MAALEDTFTPQSFAQDLLTGINAPVTQGNVAFVENWERIEGGNWQNTARYNPLNTTQLEPGSVNFTTQRAGSGVQAYPDANTGVMASVKTLLYKPYAAVVSALQANNPSGAASALVQSPWAESHYGGNTAPFLSSVPNVDGSMPTSKPTGSAPVTPVATTGAVLTDVASRSATKATPRVLAAIDDALQVPGGLNILDPVKDIKTVVARGTVVLFGLVFVVGGVIILVSSVTEQAVKVKGSNVGKLATAVAAA